MPTASTSLPVLPNSRPLRLTPTDISQFVRLEQCERFLRFRLAERAGQKFMEWYDVNPQRITPLLTLSGRSFEDGIEGELGKRFQCVHFAKKQGAHDRPSNNAEVAKAAHELAPGSTALLFQSRLAAELDGWRVRGDADLIRLDRSEDGKLRILIADLKSTAEA